MKVRVSTRGAGAGVGRTARLGWVVDFSSKTSTKKEKKRVIGTSS